MLTDKIETCRMCEAEFTIEGLNIDEPIAFCPYCGSGIEEIDEEFEEEFYDEDRIQD